MRILFTSAFIFTSIFVLQAQLQQAIISYNPTIKEAAQTASKQLTSDRNQNGAALPFFDDFAYDGPFPDATLWEDRHVFVNNTLANLPVSIGVATFDGLDATGSPYGGFGSADTLTSIPLDLSGNAPKYLSYYVQPKGLGDAPGMEDKLVLEFKNIDDEWIEVKVHEVTLKETLFPIDSLPVFEFSGAIPISDAQFLHENFQFRFRNYALRVGAADLWNIDYVRLETEPMTASNDDLAFTTLPSNILLNYSSAPWTHIQDELVNDLSLVLTDVDINFYNHAAGTIDAGDNDLDIIGIDTDETLQFRNQRLLDESSIPSGRQTIMNNITGEYVAKYRNEFKTADRIQMQVDYSFDYTNPTMPATARNNRVSRTFELSNYYAYDDNSAESAYFVGTGGQVAVKFTNYKADLLQAIRMQIPRIVGNDITESNFTLKIWVGDLKSNPIFEQPFTKPLFIDDFVDSLQAFTTYVLKDPITGEPSPVELPIGDFYVGWEQVTPCGNVNCLPVGLDRNTPSATDKILVNVDGDWKQINAFFENGEVPVSQQGALMIRPVVGSETPNDSETVDITELEINRLMQIFPNPSLGKVTILLHENNHEDYELRVFNALGQQIKVQTLNQILDLSDELSGMYFLQFVDKTTQAIGNYKLMLKL